MTNKEFDVFDGVMRILLRLDLFAGMRYDYDSMHTYYEMHRVWIDG